MAVSLFFALIGVSASSWAIQYKITDIGPLPGITTTLPSLITGINNSGDVIGRAPVGGSPSAQVNGFIWNQNDGFSDLGWLTPWAINDQGNITGNNPYGQAFIISDSSLQQPPTLVGSLVGARGINASGQLAGVWAQDGASPPQAIVRRNADDITNLSQLYGERGYAFDINDSGSVVGSLGNQGYIWNQATGLTYIDIQKTESTAWSINENGQVVGWLSDKRSNRRGYSSFIWHRGQLTIIDDLNSEQSMAFGINASGQVVGTHRNLLNYNSMGDAYIWDQVHGMLDLDSLLVGSDQWQLNEANGINDLGQIVGTGLLNGQRHGYLLTPISEPPIYALTMIALLALLFGDFPGKKRIAPGI
ncbi:MAG: DUF3466 family protein [Betaproteobacteria bacterium]|nr:DUF3466 family protein [Betaproteobacteria bacterium]